MRTLLVPLTVLAILLTCITTRAANPKRPTKPSELKSPTTAPASESSRPDTLEWFRFADRLAVPAYLRVDKQATIDAQGLHGEVFTTASDFINHDFVFDVLIDLNEERGGKPLSKADVCVGIGENRRGDTNWWKESVALRLHRERATLIETANGKESDFARIEPAATVKPDNKNTGKKTANPPIAPRSGPWVLRVAKTGNTLTLSACLGYSGTFTADITATVDDLKSQAPYLTTANSTLFIWSYRTSEYQPGILATRLIVDGAVVEMPPATVPVAVHSEEPFFTFTPTSGIPPWLKVNDRVTADANGLHGGEVRTVSPDFVSHDFTLDLLFRFREDDRAQFLIGIGENGRDGGWILNSLGAHVNGPGESNGSATVFRHRHYDNQPITIGTIGRNPGPHVFRLAKVGNTLTMAFCVNYKDKFEATYSKTLPDLKSIAPFLNANNSNLFFAAGERGDEPASWLGIRLLVDGKPLSNMTTPEPKAAP